MTDELPSSEPAAAEVASPAPRQRWIFGIAAVTVVAVGAWLLWGRGDSPSGAQRACSDLSKQGVTVAEGAEIVLSAVNDGRATYAELRDECGDLLDAIDNGLGIGPLREGVTVELDYCNPERIVGEVTNNNSVAVDVTLTYELLLGNDTRADDGLIFVDSVRPGQTARWNEYLFDTGFKTCHVRIDAVRATR